MIISCKRVAKPPVFLATIKKWSGNNEAFKLSNNDNNNNNNNNNDNNNKRKNWETSLKI